MKRIRTFVVSYLLPLFLYNGGIGPRFFYEWAAWRSHANMVQRRARAFLAAIIFFCMFGYLGFLHGLWSQGMLNGFGAFLLGYVLPVEILNRVSSSLWAFPRLGGRVMSERQIHLHEVPDNRVVRVYPNAPSSAGKKWQFVIGVKEDGSFQWYSLSSYAGGFEVEPYHILILGEKGVFRENFADYLLLRAIECNSRVEFDRSNLICIVFDGLFSALLFPLRLPFLSLRLKSPKFLSGEFISRKFIKLIFPHAVLPYKTVSNCVVIGLDDAESGMSMNHLANIPGVTIFTGAHEIKRAIAGLYEIFKERNEAQADGNVNIFVLCDHGIASAILGKNPAYLELEREIKALVQHGIRRRIKFILLPDANFLSPHVQMAYSVNFRVFQFHSRENRVKIGKHDYLKVDTEPEIPGLFHFNAPEGKVRCKMVTITPLYLREKFSGMGLTPAANYVWSRMTHDLPEFRKPKAEEPIAEPKPEPRRYPHGVEMIDGSLFRRDGNSLVQVVERNGNFFEVRGNSLRRLAHAAQEEIIPV